jgi:hypothetical protein
VGSRNCFLFHSLFCGIIIEKELHVLNKHKVRLSLSLSLLFFRGEEEETKKKKKNNNKRARRA